MEITVWEFMFSLIGAGMIGAVMGILMLALVSRVNHLEDE